MQNAAMKHVIGNEMRADVFRLAMAHPGDLSALDALLSQGVVKAETIVAIIGKTEGNGGVNDFTRGYFTDRLMSLLSSNLDQSPEEIAKNVPCILSGGTEGVLSPHYTVLCRIAESSSASGNNKALAIGAACSPQMPFELVGTTEHSRIVAETVKTAMQDAAIDHPDDLHFVQVKTPCLTSDRIEGLRKAGKPVPAESAASSMAFARAAGALGVALITEEASAADVREDTLLSQFDIHSSRASVSSGVEVLFNEVVVMGMSRNWGGPLRISHQPMHDAIDLPSVQHVFTDLGFDINGQVSPCDRGKIKAIFAKCEPDRTGQIHGARHTMLNDTDIDPQRHIRGAVGGLIAGVSGITQIFVSGGAEHQGPLGGGLVSVIAEEPHTPEPQTTKALGGDL